MTDEMKQAIIDEVREIAKERFEDWDLEREKALRCWGRKEPLPPEFESAISDAWEEWALDNFDLEDFI